MADFKAPGQHTYKGMEVAGVFPADVLDRVPSFKYRHDDVLIATYPKTGTTWLNQILSLILSDNIIETSRNTNLSLRAPMLEFYTPRDPRPYIDALVDMKSPRLIKTHLDYSFFKEAIEAPEKPNFKTIVCMRNVRDTIVSYYHYYKTNGRTNFDGDFETFFELFKAKQLFFGDYLDHSLSWWEHKDNPNILIVYYEDMKKDLRGEIEKMALFLGKTLTDTQLNTIFEESTFEAMKSNPMTNKSNPKAKMDSQFMRKGQVGDWQNYFTEEQLGYLNSRCEKELATRGLEFAYI